MPSMPLLAFTLLELIAVVALAAIIIACLISIAIDIKKAVSGSAEAAALQARQAALTDLQTVVDAVQEAGQATADDCERMRALYDAAASAGVNRMVLAAIKKRIDALCPG